MVQVTCSDTTDNYFVRTGTYCTSSDREDIAEIIANQVKTGDTVISLQFAHGKYENALLFLKNIQQVKTAVNNQLGRHKAMWDYTLHTHAKQYVIVLIKAD